MQIYRNLAGNSGVKGYEIGLDYIKVLFQNRRTYTYSYASAGKDKVETMKLLAEKGSGLSSYISRYAKYSYE